MITYVNQSMSEVRGAVHVSHLLCVSPVVVRGRGIEGHFFLVIYYMLASNASVGRD